MQMKEYIDKIVQMEWMAFDKVRNKGGRASCQNDWDTFSIMRKSQYQVWTEEMLKLYYEELYEAEKTGRNVIMEKYAYMMEYTVPEEYAEIKDQLPEVSVELMNIINGIAAVQVAWMEEFAKEYPGLAQQARTIHSAEDTPENTSYETYLIGELKTYSEPLVLAYGRFVADIFRQGGNLVKMIMEQTARLYGYPSLEKAQSSCQTGWQDAKKEEV